MMVRHSLLLAIAWAIMLARPVCVCAQEVAAGVPATREITRVRGDLYQVRDGQKYTVFVVTPEGIILVDPLGRETALWLRDEFKVRFHRDVRFVLYTSHDHARAGGASVFGDTAEIVGQAAFNDELAKAQRVSPEPYRSVLRTTLPFGLRCQVPLGGQAVGMVHVPTARRPETTVVQFPRQRVVFAGRLPGIGSVPFSFGEDGPADAFAWMEKAVDGPPRWEQQALRVCEPALRPERSPVQTAGAALPRV
jgi:hypothetical protein